MVVFFSVLIVWTSHLIAVKNNFKKNLLLPLKRLKVLVRNNIFFFVLFSIFYLKLALWWRKHSYSVNLEVLVTLLEWVNFDSKIANSFPFHLILALYVQFDVDLMNYGVLIPTRDRPIYLSADIWPYEYRPIFKFPLIFCCVCRQHSLYQIHLVSKNLKILLKFV